MKTLSLAAYLLLFATAACFADEPAEKLTVEQFLAKAQSVREKRMYDAQQELDKLKDQPRSKEKALATKKYSAIIRKLKKAHPVDVFGELALPLNVGDIGVITEKVEVQSVDGGEQISVKAFTHKWISFGVNSQYPPEKRSTAHKLKVVGVDPESSSLGSKVRLAGLLHVIEDGKVELLDISDLRAQVDEYLDGEKLW